MIVSNDTAGVSGYMHGATMSKRMPLQLQTTGGLRLIILHLNAANLLSETFGHRMMHLPPIMAPSTPSAHSKGNGSLVLQ